MAGYSYLEKVMALELDSTMARLSMDPKTALSKSKSIEHDNILAKNYGLKGCKVPLSESYLCWLNNRRFAGCSRWMQSFRTLARRM